MEMTDSDKTIDGFAYWIDNEENGVCYIPLNLCVKILELLKEQPQWISVKDRLPDSAGASVIVTAVNRFGQVSVFTAFQGYGDFKWYTMETTKMDDDTCNMVSSNWTITHWMPLPEPPEEE